MKAKIGKLQKVWVPIDISWASSEVIGVYSTLDSALDSVYNFLEDKYPDSVWIWDGYKQTLENGDDPDKFIGFYDFKVDYDEWR